jgi:ABC-type enterochelin transport system permease subunit
MKSRMIRKVAVLVTGSALALSLLVASAFADKGGVPNSHSGTCKSKGQGTSKSLSSLPSQAQTKGKKCGFNK